MSDDMLADRNAALSLKDSAFSDAQLRQFVELINGADPGADTPVPLPITIVADGAIITGGLISYARFIRTFSAMYGLDEMYAGYAERSEREAAKHLKEPHPSQVPSFLHLQDARFVTGPAGTVPSEGDGMLLRVRLSAVTSWSFLTLATTKK